MQVDDKRLEQLTSIILIHTLSIPLLLLPEKLQISSNTKSGVIISNLKWSLSLSVLLLILLVLQWSNFTVSSKFKSASQSITNRGEI